MSSPPSVWTRYLIGCTLSRWLNPSIDAMPPDTAECDQGDLTELGTTAQGRRPRLASCDDR
jgi:hypothetical protein